MQFTVRYTSHVKVKDTFSYGESLIQQPKLDSSSLQNIYALLFKMQTIIVLGTVKVYDKCF